MSTSDSAGAGEAESQSSTFLRAIIDSVAEAIAVIDGNGAIVLVNEAWQRFAVGNGLEPGKPAPRTEVGANYLDVCQSSARIDETGARDALDGIRAVLDGRLPGFDLEYPCHLPDHHRWFSMRVTPVALRSGPGAVVAHVDITRNKQAEESALAAHELLESLTTTVPGVVYLLSRNDVGECKFLHVSKGIRELFEITAGEVLRDHNALTACILAEDRIAYAESLEHSARTLGLWVHEFRIHTASGTFKWVRGQAVPHRQEDGSVVWNGIFLDITARQRSQDVIKASEEKYRALVETTGTGYLILDMAGRVVDANPEYVRLTGHGDLGEILGRQVTEWTAPHEKEKNAEAVIQCVRDGFIRNLIIDYVDANGRITPIEINATVVGDGDAQRMISLCRDITRRKHLEDQVRQLAFYDPLTNLPNRRLLDDRLSQAMASGNRTGCHGALMFIDLDNFKSLNDSHGHDVGDLLLIQAAERLKSCIRETDTVARFGGDEFVVMIGELVADQGEPASQVEMIARKIAAALAIPYVLDVTMEGQTEMRIEHRCTASIGVTLFFGQELARSDVLKRADAAMYKAKAAGENLIRRYEAVL